MGEYLGFNPEAEELAKREAEKSNQEVQATIDAIKEDLVKRPNMAGTTLRMFEGQNYAVDPKKSGELSRKDAEIIRAAVEEFLQSSEYEKRVLDRKQQRTAAEEMERAKANSPEAVAAREARKEKERGEFMKDLPATREGVEKAQRLTTLTDKEEDGELTEAEEEELAALEAFMEANPNAGDTSELEASFDQALTLFPSEQFESGGNYAKDAIVVFPDNTIMLRKVEKDYDRDEKTYRFMTMTEAEAEGFLQGPKK